MQSVESQLTFQKNVPPPSSGLKNKPSKQMCLPPDLMLVSCLAYSLILKMETLAAKAEIAK
jgi:hypothetical protein